MNWSHSLKELSFKYWSLRGSKGTHPKDLYSSLCLKILVLVILIKKYIHFLTHFRFLGSNNVITATTTNNNNILVSVTCASLWSAHFALLDLLLQKWYFQNHSIILVFSSWEKPTGLLLDSSKRLRLAFIFLNHLESVFYSLNVIFGYDFLRLLFHDYSPCFSALPKSTSIWI